MTALPLSRLPHHLQCLIVRLSLSSLSCICPFCLFILGTFPIVGLDIILNTPTPEFLWLRADQTSVGDPGVVLEPVDKVVDVVVTDPGIAVKRELPQEVEVL